MARIEGHTSERNGRLSEKVGDKSATADFGPFFCVGFCEIGQKLDWYSDTFWESCACNLVTRRGFRAATSAISCMCMRNDKSLLQKTIKIYKYKKIHTLIC